MTKRKTKTTPPASVAAQPLKLPRPGSKMAAIIDLLQRPGGATIADLMAATSWQQHSIRGALAGALKKRFGLTIASEKREGGRIYRVVPTEPES